MPFVDDAKRKFSDRVSGLLMLHKGGSQIVCEEFSGFSEDGVGEGHFGSSAEVDCQGSDLLRENHLTVVLRIHRN